MRPTIALVLFSALTASGCLQHPRPPIASAIALPARVVSATEHAGTEAAVSLATAATLLPVRPAVCDTPSFAGGVPVSPEQQRYLVLSGGSLNGAFGAGFFLGLSEAGARGRTVMPPEPSEVTGVSTGSLQATFLFLGASHRPPLDRSYSWAGGAATVSTALDDPTRPALVGGRSNYEDLALAYAIRREGDILRVAPFGGVGMLATGSKGTLEPLRKRLLGLISPGTIHDVAFEACRRRTLLVGVADANDGQAYAIDLTRLALMAYTPQLQDGRPYPMDAVRQAYVSALLASSSVPVGARPVTLLIDTGNLSPPFPRLRHLFIDGGARFGVFFEDLRQQAAATRTAAADGYGVTLLVNTRLALGPWNEEDDPRRPRDGWLMSTLGLRAVDILENQVYRLSVDAVETRAAALGGLHMAFISNEHLEGLAGRDDGTEPPGTHGYRGRSCDEWHRTDKLAEHPAQFYPTYMACLIDYGRQRGQLGLWNPPAPREPAAPGAPLLQEQRSH